MGNFSRNNCPLFFLFFMQLTNNKVTFNPHLNMSFGAGVGTENTATPAFSFHPIPQSDVMLP